MKIRIFLLVVACAVFNAQSLYSQSIASAMGDNVTTLPSGAADVTRNPALLAWDQRKMEFLGFAGFLFYSFQDPALDAEIAMPPLTVEQGPFEMYSPEKQALGGGGAWFVKSGKAAFGVAIQGYSKKERNSFDLNLSVPALSVSILFRNKETRYESSTSGYTTFSYRMNNNLSLGLQYKLEYKTEHEESENRGFTNAAASSWEYKSSTENSFVSEGILGVLVDIQPFCIGLALLSPDYSYKKNKYENEKDDYDTPANSYSLADSSPEQWVVTNNAGMVLGIGVNVTSDITITGEFGFRLNGSYNETILVVNYTTYEEVDQKNEYQKLFLFSLGMKYVIDHGLSAACGAFGRFISMENHYEGTSASKRVEIDYLLFGLRLGFEKKISSVVSLVIVGSLEHAVMNIDAQSTQGTMRMRFEEKNTEDSFNLNAAVRFML